MHDLSPSRLVSVIIPVYNGEKYLRDAIESVISQSYKPIEIIIVDDGSQDSSWDIIQSYHPEVVGIQKENGGVASALNRGISNAAGEYIAWLSHDDIFTPQKIERQVDFLAQYPNAGVCYTDFDIMDADKNYVATVHAEWHPRQEIAYSFLRNMYINGSTTMIRKLCFETVGLFDENLKFTQDLDLWLRISREFDIIHLPKVLLHSRSHPEQGSWDFENHLVEEISTFSNLYKIYGCSTFFPSLVKVNDVRKQEALGMQNLGDEMLVHRHWYRFASDQYRSALQIQPIARVRLKLILSQLLMRLFGDEQEALCLVRRARMVINQGDGKKARALAVAMFVKHPLRFDALAIWFTTLIPTPLIQQIKSIKHRLNGLISSRT